MSFERRVEDACQLGLDDRALRVALLHEVRSVVPYDAYAWLSTDPETWVGSSPVAETPSLADLPALIRLKYLTRTNRWTSLQSSMPSTLALATNGALSSSRLWRELLVRYGVKDVVSIVFLDIYGCWGFLDLWRTTGTFSDDERSLLGRFAIVVTTPVRRSLISTFAHGSTARESTSGPAMLLLSEDLELLIQTSQTDAYLRELLPTDAGRSPVPAAALNVAAQLLAREAGVDIHPASARVHVREGLWVTLRAARVEARSPMEATAIAVSIEPTPPLERSSLYARVLGLSEREAELLQHLVAGGDTRELSVRMFVSEHTVQDHFKSIFAKTGVNSRRLLVARATGVA